MATARWLFPDGPGDLPPIGSVSVNGFKSIAAACSIQVRPLTVLAGTNSSGKSSMIQPLLLLKQTLESPFDPGPLLLNGRNVKFTSIEQLLSKGKRGTPVEVLSFAVELGSGYRCELRYERGSAKPIELVELELSVGGRVDTYRVGEFPLKDTPFRSRFPKDFFGRPLDKAVIRIGRNRCFLEAVVVLDKQDPATHFRVSLGHETLEEVITRVIHVPGLRGNPQRNYPVTAVGDRFVGTFEDYVASVIAAAEPGFLAQLGRDLRDLGLTWKVEAKSVDDTQVELRVGRLLKSTQGGAHDLVSIADVGFGVSQTLPVVVALLTARPNQLVYIEQPEIHLHPRAQHAMAGLLARAANRGVRVVVETHSSILLLGLQSAVARGEVAPDKVKLHWFQRDERTGATHVVSADVNEAGAFPGWPEDFDDVSLEAQRECLDAADKKLAHES